MKGKVYLVGAGPGDPELLTLKAAQLLASADVVLHDDLVTPEILARVSPATQVVSVGKRCGRKRFTQEEINQLMVSYAGDHSTIVRLKGGDPLIFGRAGEEMQALREAGVEFEVVPGVTSALAAAATAQVSLTDRHIASSVVFTTGHRHENHNDGSRGSRGDASSHPTVVVYMPSDYAAISEELMAAGWPAETPCLIVSRASTGEEESSLTTLANLPQAPRLALPKVLIIGAALRDMPVPSPSKLYAASI